LGRCRRVERQRPINLVIDLDFEELEDGGGEMGEKSYVEKLKVLVETLNVGAKRWAKKLSNVDRVANTLDEGVKTMSMI